MGKMYSTIETLAKAKGFKNVSRLCDTAGVARSILTDLKRGRSDSLSQKNVQKLAEALGVSASEIYGENRPVSDEDIKFALFGGAEVSDEMFAEVKAFAEFVKQRGERNGHTI